LGRKYDLNKKEDAAAWIKDGGLETSPEVCASAARLAAEIILDIKEKA